MTPSKEIRYVNLLPYCKAKGCQQSNPHPASRNKYPVPWFRALTETPVSSDRGTSTEYTTDVEIPANRVYLDGVSMVSNWLLRKLETHMLVQTVESSLRLGDQFRGSFGSVDGAGIRTMSLFPLAC